MDEPRRLEGLLRDYCPNDKRGVSLLLNALQENIPRELMALDPHIPLEISANRLIRRLVDNRGINEDAAAWCVEAWAFALGVTLPGRVKTPGPLPPVSSPFGAAAQGAPPVIKTPQSTWAMPRHPYQVTKRPTELNKVYLVLGITAALGLVLFIGWVLIKRVPGNKPPAEALQYYDQAETARLQGNNTAAVGLYDKAIVLFADYRMAYLGRGKVLLAMGQLDKSLADFNKAVELDPNDADGYYQRGLVLIEKKDDQKALADFNKAIEIKPDWAEPYSRRALILDERGENAQALEDYSKALELNFQPAADILLRRGSIYARDGDNPSAIEDYRKAIELDPRNARAYYLRGMARAELLDLDGAIEDLERALELNPSDEGIYYRRGLVYDRMGEDEKAIADYSKAIDINDMNPVLFYKRGILMNRLERFDEAINDFTAVIRLGNDPQMTYDAYLARSYTHARKGDLERAVYDAGKTTELDAENAEGWNSLCWLGSLSGKAADVLPACETAVEMSPTNGNYRDSRGVARVMTDDYAGAIEDFKAFLVWQETRRGSETDRNLRKSWVASLEAGKNPFTESVIKQLLRQETLFGGEGRPSAVALYDDRAVDQPPACLDIGQLWLTSSDDAILMCVPAGEFLMGSKPVDAIAYPNEVPQHRVYLDAFWMDIYEVTNERFARCVQAGICLEPLERVAQFRDPQYASTPVVVPWEQARSYCSWAGRRLPTEAEWEKAAHGEEPRIFPWGDRISCELANYSGCHGEPVAVGSYPESTSPYGMFDMAGNVWEWVSDWYAKDYYQVSPPRNPAGPQAGDQHVVRGGAWDSFDPNLRTTYRIGYGEGSHGFRCVWSEKPAE